jgi:hypothetical protein
MGKVVLVNRSSHDGSGVDQYFLYFLCQLMTSSEKNYPFPGMIEEINPQRLAVIGGNLLQMATLVIAPAAF